VDEAAGVGAGRRRWNPIDVNPDDPLPSREDDYDRWLCVHLRRQLDAAVAARKAKAGP